VNINIAIEEVFNDKLSPDDLSLRNAAIDAAAHAYAPFSRLNVGAAVKLIDGTIVSGNNQENVAFPSGLCAERVALFAATANFPDSPPVAIAIVALSNNQVHEHIAPCGACRQVLLETEKRFHLPLKTLLCGNSITYIFPSAELLLPLAFSF
jgi:cytidine deaminase